MSEPTLYDLMDCNHQASLPMGFSRQEYWSCLPFPPSGGLPYPEIDPASPELPALVAVFTTGPPRKPVYRDQCPEMRLYLDIVRPAAK